MTLPFAHLPARSILSASTIDQTITLRISSLVILVLTIIVFGARQVTKAIVFRKVALDDLLIFVAFSFGVSLSIMAIVSSFEGLGAVGPSTREQTQLLMKGYYVSEIVYVVAIGFTKSSILVLFYNVVTKQRIMRRVVIAFGIVVSAWTMASLVAMAIQCGPPRSWGFVSSLCFDSRTFWMVYCIVDISTEAAIIMLSIHLVTSLQVRLSTKLSVIACFAPRILVLSAAIVRLVLLYPATPYIDPQHRLWVPAIMSQVHVCLSIATASIPYMVPFFKGLDGNLRRDRPAKSQLHHIGEEMGRSKASLWSRRHNKTKALNLWNPTSGTDVQYNRVPQVSPYIPAPRPLSPLSSPRPLTPLGKQASVHGLNIYLPCRDPRRQRSLDWVSPRTESSGVLSPLCASPQALLSTSFIPSRKAPSPPARVYSPRPLSSSSCYSSRTPTPALTTPSAERFSPQCSTSTSPQPQQNPSLASSVPPIRAMRSQTVSTSTKSPVPSLQKSPASAGSLLVRSSSYARPQRFSTTTHLETPPLMNAHEGSGIRPGSIQDLTSPMGAAINGWFSSAETKYPSPSPSPKDTPPDWQPTNDQYELSPMRSIDTPRSPLPSHVRSHARVDVSRNVPRLPQDILLHTRTSRSQKIPSVRDVRHNPRIVYRDPC